MKRYLVDLVIAIIAVFAPIQGVLTTVGVLVFADLVMGIWAAKKRGESITSGKMSRTVVKFFIYEVSVLMAFLVETYLMNGWLPVCKIVASLIGSVELKSLLENAQSIQGSTVFNAVIGELKKESESELPAPNLPKNPE